MSNKKKIRKIGCTISISADKTQPCYFANRNGGYALSNVYVSGYPGTVQVCLTPSN